MADRPVLPCAELFSLSHTPASGRALHVRKHALKGEA